MNKRHYVIGSDWLYIKLYSGPKTLEHIFVNEIYNTLTVLLNQGLIDYFFFIRYNYPNYHIRLRLHFKNVNNIGPVILALNSFFEELINSHIISSVIIDTYSREIERYGDEYISDVEKLFFFDSIFILKYLSDNKEEDANRWLVSVKYIDSFLDNCGLSLDNKIAFCEIMSDSILNDISSNPTFVNKQLNIKYRECKKNIQETIEILKDQDSRWIYDLNTYLKDISFFIIKINSKINEESISNIFPLLSSIIHMHVNRMFRTKQRINEFTIYYLLVKYYKSKKARLTYNIPPKL